ncbi:MAG: NAD-dependent epimerase/dehydratase family protein, partial [Bdellovibrionales bacterium]|nr:NAD-dependent epimerase/dehydratase family protein [Bdellovibrionales bacterium]
YYDINVMGTKNVIEAAIKSGVKRVVHCSTVGVHSHIPHPPADETEAYRPGDIYQETKCEGEKLALSYFNSGKIFGVVVRPAMIWGPEDKRTLKIFKGIARGRFPLIGSGKTYLHWVLVTDLARGFRLAAERAQTSGSIYIFAGRTPVTMRNLYESIAGLFGVPSPKFSIPAFPVQLIGSLCELVCKPFGIEPPIYRRRVDFFTKTRSFSIEKARKELGYEPEHDLKGEVSVIGNWYRDQGWI